MKTQVIMKRELFGKQIKQQSKTEFFSATDLINIGNQWRIVNGFKPFNLSLYLKGKAFTEFKNEMQNKYGEVMTSGRGRNSQTWVHPILFIDIALAINPKLKIEVYEWLFDSLIKYRNESGDSYKEMSSALWQRWENKRTFAGFIQDTAKNIKTAIAVVEWENATEQQLDQRNKIHFSIKILCNVLKDPEKAVELGIKEYLKIV